MSEVPRIVCDEDDSHEAVNVVVTGSYMYGNAPVAGYTYAMCGEHTVEHFQWAERVGARVGIVSLAKVVWQ